LFSWIEKSKGSESKTSVVKIIDASWHQSTTKRDARKEYENEHIVGAVFFDIDKCATTGGSTQVPHLGQLPHMLPTAKMFAAELKKLGINKSDCIVIYDNSGLFTASTRLWWQFQVFGCVSENIFILDGGLDSWKAGKYPTDSGSKDIPRGDWDFEEYESQWVANIDDVIKLVSDSESKEKVQIVDARPLARFNGLDAEPRAVLRRGHIPGAISIPWQEVTQVGEGKLRQLKSPSDILKVFKDAKVDLSKPIMTYCGSGVTAATLTFCLNMLGAKGLSLYDGSWAEWGNVEKVSQLIEPKSKSPESS